MSSSIADTSNHHEQDDLSAEVNQQAVAKDSVEFNRHGEPVGPLATHFKARVGKFVNTYAPISYKTWSQVPKNFKNDIWNAILEQVKAKVLESKQSEGSNSSIHPLSIDEDPLAQVFGKKAKGLPGVGSFVTKRKYDSVLHSHIMHSEEINEKKDLGKKVDNIQKQLDVIVGYVKPQKMGGPSTPMHIPDVAPISMPEVQPMPMHKEASRSSTPLPETMSNACRTLGGEGDSATSIRIEPNPTTRFCKLLDWNKNVVAVAKEVTDPMHKGMCHNYRLNEHEMKVSICVRKLFSAKLYKETPDAKTIQEVGLGDFLVWPKVLIRFEEPQH